MEKIAIIRYFLINFALMFVACLLVDLVTYISHKTTDIWGSLIIASIGATVYTLIHYIIEYRKMKRI